MTGADWVIVIVIAISVIQAAISGFFSTKPLESRA